MEREGFDIPLLIGGATTSKKHTAVKIGPEYSRGPVIHVLDASRAVGVVSSLLSDELRPGFVASIRDEYEALREGHEGRQRSALLPIEEARRNRLPVDWSQYHPLVPARPGVMAFDDYDLAEISRLIDWSPFFDVWDINGRYPGVLDDSQIGEQATHLFEDAQEMLGKIITNKWLTASGVIGLFPANSMGDDIELYTDASRRQVVSTVHTLRQQAAKSNGRPNLALADFIAPKESGLSDYLGMFAVTAGIGLPEMVTRYESAHDDYRAIMAKALADRLAEAFAELMHLRVRREFWGYSPDESLDNGALIAEQYRGIRPAPGYPACPDHTEKGELFRLLDVPGKAGITLTESFAMLPAASVSGYYFAHPQAAYFGVGRIGKDQVEDYARRKGMDVAEVQRWLASNVE
jgi:5-methyltetrahydrofolate--homocysteine methyltransferase